MCFIQKSHTVPDKKSLSRLLPYILSSRGSSFGEDAENTVCIVLLYAVHLTATGKPDFWTVRCLQIIVVTKGLILEEFVWTDKVFSWMPLQQSVAVSFHLIQCCFNSVLQKIHWMFLIYGIWDKVNGCFSFIFVAFITLSPYKVDNFSSEKWPSLLWHGLSAGGKLQL